MAVKTVLKITLTTDRAFLPDQVQKLLKTIKGLMPLLQLVFDKIGLKGLTVKLEDKDV